MKNIVFSDAPGMEKYAVQRVVGLFGENWKILSSIAVIKRKKNIIDIRDDNWQITFCKNSQSGQWRVTTRRMVGCGRKWVVDSFLQYPAIVSLDGKTLQIARAEHYFGGVIGRKEKNLPSQFTYYESGELKSEGRFENGVLHDYPDGEPAVVGYWKNSTIKSKIHCCMGNLNNSDQERAIRYYRKNGELEEAWSYVNGKVATPFDGGCVYLRYKDGRICEGLANINGIQETLTAEVATRWENVAMIRKRSRLCHRLCDEEVDVVALAGKKTANPVDAGGVCCG